MPKKDCRVRKGAKGDVQNVGRPEPDRAAFFFVVVRSVAADHSEWCSEARNVVAGNAAGWKMGWLD